MELKELGYKQALTELANKLFMYTDARQWDLLQQEVFAGELWFDMRSAGGGEPKTLTATAICAMWQEGFTGLDAVHHQAGQYLVTLHKTTADIYAYAIASHYKKSATKGIRTMVGSYDLKAQLTASGWRLVQFIYHLKYTNGNLNLE